MTPAEIVSEVIRSVAEKVAVGVNLLELEKRAEATLTILDAQSAIKGYHPKWATYPFPSVICLGVNDVISHEIPKDYTLKDGDLLHIDCAIVKDGMYGDCGMTIPIGTISGRDERLLRYAKRALYIGINEIKPGIKITKIGESIEKYAKNMGFVVNKVFHGHGIGKTMHEELQIPHFAIPKENVKVGNKYEYKEKEGIPTLYIGQVVCLEPSLTYKDTQGKIDEDGWTCRTRDGKKSAMFEEMIKITDYGFDILTNHLQSYEENYFNKGKNLFGG